MHSPESILENEMHKLLWDFEIQTDLLILARRPDQVLVYKKKENLLNGGLHHPSIPLQKKGKRKISTLVEN